MDRYIKRKTQHNSLTTYVENNNVKIKFSMKN